MQLHPDRQSHTVFHTEDGLHEEQFNFGSKCVSPDGKLFFRGVTGFTFFYPESIGVDDSHVQVFIDAIKINNSDINMFPEKSQFSGHISNISQLQLTHEHNSISIQGVEFDQSVA